MNTKDSLNLGNEIIDEIIFRTTKTRVRLILEPKLSVSNCDNFVWISIYRDDDGV